MDSPTQPIRNFVTLSIVLSNMKNEEILHHTASRLHDREYIYRIVRPGGAVPAKVSYTHTDDSM